MVSAARARARIDDDPTFYPIEEKVGEDSLQTVIAAMLRDLVDDYLVSRGKATFVGTDQFIYWVQHRPQKCVAPDVYVLPGVPRDGRVSCVKTWESGLVPTFAVEVVSPNSVDKDYRESPDKYDELGVEELVIFDPEHRKSRDRLRFQVFRRVRGRFARVAAHNDDRVRSRVLGCWIVAVGPGDRVRLRVGTGQKGETLLPTARERSEHDRARADQEHARAEREHARAEQERARAEEAEAELARLRAEIARLKK